MTVSSISIPLLVALRTGAYLLTGGDIRQTIMWACGAAIGIIVANFINLR